MSKKEAETRFKANMMQAMIEAALTGHDLSDWQAVDQRQQHYQAVCRRCGQPAIISAAAAIVIPGSYPGLVKEKE